MNKREAELQRCLEKTLEDLRIIDKKAPMISWATFDESNKPVYESAERAINRITRTLRKGK